MLQLNIQNICAQRKIDRPYSFLRSLGIGHSTAYQLLNQKNSVIKLQHLQIICIALKCTPNDLINYTPDKGYTVPDTHPITTLKPSTATQELNIALQQLPLDKLQQLNQLIAQLNSNTPPK